MSKKPRVDIHIFSDPRALAQAAANHILAFAEERLSAAKRFELVLSGGSTPADTYRALVDTDPLDWSRVHISWGDERCVPPDHASSNYRMAREALLDHIAIPTENIYRMVCEKNPEAGALLYEDELRKRFPHQSWPTFDLVLLGLGEDGHTASLFPGTDVLDEQERWVAPVLPTQSDNWRLTLTLPAINAASQVIFLVSGESKSLMVRKLLQPGEAAPGFPAGRIRPKGKVVWFLDQAAASRLD